MPDSTEPQLDLDKLFAQLENGDIDAVRGVLGGAWIANVIPDSRLAEWVELCEQCGLPGLGMRLGERALERAPADVGLRDRLVELCVDQGEHARAQAILERALEQQPDDAAAIVRLGHLLRARGLITRAAAVIRRAREAGVSEDALEDLANDIGTDSDELPDHPLLPPTADLVRFLDLFGGREDVHARQWFDPDRGAGYSPVHAPLDLRLLRNHVLGNVTLGVYPIRRDGTVGFLVVDLDIDRAALERSAHDAPALQTLRDAVRDEASRWLDILRDVGGDPILEDSGFKGRHLWMFFEPCTEATQAHAIARGLLATHAHTAPPNVHVEIFPKQARVRRNGLGNLIKLPLGVHRRSGRRSTFLNDTGEPITEPWSRLREVRPLDAFAISEAVRKLSTANAAGPRHPTHEHSGTITPDGPHLATLPWTRAHFAASPEVAQLMDGCALLRGLRDDACERNTLSYQAQLVLRHTLGHLAHGPLAVNYLLGRCRPVPETQMMGARLRGSPMSCAKIRGRVELPADCAECSCDFSFAPDSYPHPVLHVRTLPAERRLAPEEVDPTGLPMMARAFVAAREDEKMPREELDALSVTLTRLLDRAPDRAIAIPDGTLRLVDQEGQPRLIWTFESAAQAGPAADRTGDDAWQP